MTLAFSYLLNLNLLVKCYGSTSAFGVERFGSTPSASTLLLLWGLWCSGSTASCDDVSPSSSLGIPPHKATFVA